MIVVNDPFTQAVNFVLLQEGGYSEDPGPTNKGIEQAEYDQYRRINQSPVQSVKLITAAEAVNIYKRSYWGPVLALAGNLTLLTIFLFDTAVNMGESGATKLLQTAIQTNPDGLWGPHSREALTQYLSSHNEYSLVTYLGELREARYIEISKEGNNVKYLKGWLSRIAALETLLAARHDQA